jgi:hypothetical protein
MSDGAIVPWVLTVIPLVLVGMLALRLLGPAVEGMGRTLSRRRVGTTEGALGDAALRQMELELVEARRQIRELEEKMAWQGKLLNADTA